MKRMRDEEEYFCGCISRGFIETFIECLLTCVWDSGTTRYAKLGEEDDQFDEDGNYRDKQDGYLWG